MSTITSSGLGSGLDIKSLVTQLVEAEKTPQSRLLTRKAETLEAQISALGSFKSAISGLSRSLSDLTDTRTFDTLKASSSHESILTASTLGNADAGNYLVQVKQLAQNHALASGAYDSADAVIGTGTLTIQLGTDPTSPDFALNTDRGTLSLTIDSSNNTLTGIRDAINATKGGVTAAVINDGSGYRLALTATDGGVKNAMRLSVDSSDGLTALNYNETSQNLTQTQDAQDARLTLNGLEISSTSNDVSGVLKGVTLHLDQAQVGTNVRLTIQPDTDTITKSLQGFVDAYNELHSTLKTVAGYDSKTRTAAALFGDSSINTTMSRLRDTFNAAVPGLSGSLKTLSDVGISFQSDGTLNLNTSRLNSVLTEKPEDVQAFFSILGRTDNVGVAYVRADTDTKPGAYAVDISQAATRATLLGETIGGGLPLTVDATNDTLAVQVNGVNSEIIKLTQGTSYTGDSLAAELQSRINGDSALKTAGVTVEVKYDSDNDRFTFASSTYGSESSFAITMVGSGAASIGLSQATGEAGRDVAGTIGGQAAVGKGQLLTAATGDPNGLQLLVTGTETGAMGKVNFSRGKMDALDTFLNAVLDSKNGTLATKSESLDKALERNTTEQQDLDARMTALESRLYVQFNAMDAIVATLESTSDYLTQAIESLNFNNNSK